MEILWIILMLDALICGFLASCLAELKGHSSGAWLACGFFFGILGLIAAAGLPLKQTTASAGLIRKCPHCAELIRAEANVCRYCARDLVRNESEITRLSTVCQAYQEWADDRTDASLTRFATTLQSYLERPDSRTTVGGSPLTIARLHATFPAAVGVPAFELIVNAIEDQQRGVLPEPPHIATAATRQPPRGCR